MDINLLTAMFLIFCGSFIQSATGFGLAVVAAPILIQLSPEFIPGPIIIVGLFLSVVNALKYGGEDLSEIRIGYEESEEFHTFSVSDDGAGIREGDYERIFAAFRRGETYKAVEGVGLGLAIVAEIAERHKGRVWAEPQGDRWTTFHISIAKDV